MKKYLEEEQLRHCNSLNVHSIRNNSSLMESMKQQLNQWKQSMLETMNNHHSKHENTNTIVQDLQKQNKYLENEIKRRDAIRIQERLELESVIQNLRKQIQNANEQDENGESLLHHAQHELQLTRDRLASAEKGLTLKSKHIKELHVKLKQLIKQSQEQQSEHNVLTESLNELRDQMKEHKKREELLQVMIEKLQGEKQETSIQNERLKQRLKDKQIKLVNHIQKNISLQKQYAHMVQMMKIQSSELQERQNQIVEQMNNYREQFDHKLEQNLHDTHEKYIARTKQLEEQITTYQSLMTKMKSQHLLIVREMEEKLSREIIAAQMQQEQLNNSSLQLCHLVDSRSIVSTQDSA